MSRVQQQVCQTLYEANPRFMPRIGNDFQNPISGDQGFMRPNFPNSEFCHKGKAPNLTHLVSLLLIFTELAFSVKFHVKSSEFCTKRKKKARPLASNFMLYRFTPSSGPQRRRLSQNSVVMVTICIDIAFHEFSVEFHGCAKFQ